MVAHEFWIEFRPDVLKRQRARVRLNSAPGEKPMPLAHVLGYVHLYTILGFEDGIRYEVLLSQAGGATKGEVLDTLAPCTHSGQSASASAQRRRRHPANYKETRRGALCEGGLRPAEFGLWRDTRVRDEGRHGQLVEWYTKTIARSRATCRSWPSISRGC